MIKLTEEKLAQIKTELGNENVLFNEPLKNHSNMEVGGPADYVFTPDSKEKAAKIVEILREENIHFIVIGNGSNILFRDEGFEGVVVKISEKISGIEIEGERAKIDAGLSNKEISSKLIEAGLSGFEFASGIPGCLGGGIKMNAGAYEGEMQNVIEDVTVLDKEGNIKVIPKEEMDFGYRTSCVKEKGYVVLAATLKLEKKPKDEIQKKVDELTKQREEKQPLEYPSCGSVFKRPEGHFAGALITEAGLKGKMIGGAQVSEKHAGFIVNRGGATCKDVLDLIAYVQQKVFENSGVELKCEIEVI